MSQSTGGKGADVRETLGFPLGLGGGSVDTGLNHYVAEHFSSKHISVPGLSVTATPDAVYRPGRQ